MRSPSPVGAGGFDGIGFDGSVIDKSFFDQYYEDREQAVAYKLKNVIKYREPKELKDYGISSAPQSFQYIETLVLSIVLKHL